MIIIIINKNGSKNGENKANSEEKNAETKTTSKFEIDVCVCVL